MSLKALVASLLLAVTAVATDYGSGDSSYGSGGSGSGASGSGGWSSWSTSASQGAPAFAAASCPAGCVPIPTGSAPPPLQTQPGQLIVQVVSVSDANGSLKYFPDKVTAPVGSIVQFQYHPKVCLLRFTNEETSNNVPEPHSHRVIFRRTVQTPCRQPHQRHPSWPEIRLRPGYGHGTIHPSLQCAHQRHQAYLDLLRPDQPLSKGYGHGD